MLDRAIEEMREMVHGSAAAAVLTGAGISTESGISDFRSPGGVWSTYRAVTIQEFLADQEKRKYYWRYKYETIPGMLEGEPNSAHMALGDFYRRGKLSMLITQNIDGLHEKGGVGREKIINIHGTNSEAVCLSCGEVTGIMPVLERITRGEEVPLCLKCGGFLKPNTISFGQNLVHEDLLKAERSVQACGLFMALGSSLIVQPACSLVDIARKHGKKIIIINRDETPYDHMADCRHPGPLGIVLPLITGAA